MWSHIVTYYSAAERSVEFGVSDGAVNLSSVHSTLAWSAVTSLDGVKAGAVLLTSVESGTSITDVLGRESGSLQPKLLWTLHVCLTAYLADGVSV